MQEKHTYRTHIKVDELAFFLAHNSRPFECSRDEMGYCIRFKCEPDFLEYAIKERPQFSMINFFDDGIHTKNAAGAEWTRPVRIPPS